MKIVIYSIGVTQPITPAEPLPPLPPIPRGSLVVVEGRSPIWRYGSALHRLHGSAAGAVAFYDPRLGGVIVASHIPQYREGDVVDLDLPDSEEERHPAENNTTTPSAMVRPLDERILDWLRPIRLTPLRITFRFATGTEYEISRLRGVWGRALKTVDEAAYAKIFEGNGEIGRQTPRYLIRPADIFEDQEFAEEEDGFQEKIDFITWGITEAERRILLRAWSVASNFGLGHDRLPFALESVTPWEESSGAGETSVTDLVSRRRSLSDMGCRLFFPVPLRLIAFHGGVKRRIESPILPDLIRATLSRLTTLRHQILDRGEHQEENDRFRCGDTPDFTEEVMTLSEKTPALLWQGEQLALRRYSGRQKAEIDLVGTAGGLELPNGPGPLWPLLAAGEIFHLGKSTALGLGRLVLQSIQT